MLKINLSGLTNEISLNACPHDASRMEGMKKLFKDWTEKDDSSIFSGYRKETLKKTGLKESQELALKLREKFSTLVVLGIGGSALGAKTAIESLKHTVPHEKRKKVFILENLDPLEFQEIFESLDLNNTCLALVTKSGATLETMSQASVFFEAFKKAGLDLKNHIVAITDPKSGSLRKWVNSQGLMNLSVPPTVGGRFSVFTPVGAFPLFFFGIDAEKILEGAIKFFKGSVCSFDEVSLMALRLAEMEEGGFFAHVLWPYASVLKNFGAWFVQLWGESLGKMQLESQKVTRKRVGSMPVAAVGATDQHSLLQFVVEGPNRMVNGFIRVKNFSEASSSYKCFALPEEFSSLKFAEGKNFNTILNAELEATELVLREQVFRPTYCLELDNLNEETFGALLALYMDLTSLVGAYHGINPYDQPGVEHGKKMMPKILA